MKFLTTLFVLLCLNLSLFAQKTLPQNKTFIGQAVFEKIIAKAEKEQWHSLPLGERMAHIALQLESIPYVAYTLEIDNHIEAPSVNLKGLDCWTFFEAVFCMARMMDDHSSPHTPTKLLKEIEFTRYRDGKCNGNYLDRIHYLMEWYKDNEKRGTITNLTKKFPSQEMPNVCDEMTKLWKYYRYLKHNPELRKGMGEHEKRITDMQFYMVPKAKVKAIESELKNGDIIGIARHGNGSYCSHVGLIIKDNAGVARFMHASSTYKKVVIDASISDYLHKFKKHAGIVIARPK